MALREIRGRGFDPLNPRGDTSPVVQPPSQTRQYAPPLPGPDWVAIRTEALWGATSGMVVARLAEDSPEIVAGGGFEDVARPLRRGLPQWRGSATPTLPLSLILGDLTGSYSVEADCKTLRHLAGGLMPGDPAPPELLLFGQMLPYEARAPSRRWVISDAPAWDTSSDGVLRRDDGDRVRQAVAVTLMLVSDDNQLQAIKPTAVKPRYRHVKSKAGDTFEKIAKRELGTARLAHKLAALNGKGGGSVSVKLKTNTDVKVPTGTLLAEWKRDIAKAH